MTRTVLKHSMYGLIDAIVIAIEIAIAIIIVINVSKGLAMHA